ncbi:hypothetical protein SSX86_008564 [Deinandra increscens subsp. villosa]|uniref:Uncharacterized protein n=1 Tax=Deinandra increscens subsp. villosa TaxID=3103831 RepID=A0AAP0H561_9ASTR
MAKKNDKMDERRTNVYARKYNKRERRDKNVNADKNESENVVLRNIMSLVGGDINQEHIDRKKEKLQAQNTEKKTTTKINEKKTTNVEMPKYDVGSNEGKDGDDIPLVQSIISNVVDSIKTKYGDVHQEESTYININYVNLEDNEAADGEENANDQPKDGKNAGSEKRKSLMKSLSKMVEPTSKKKNNEEGREVMNKPSRRQNRKRQLQKDDNDYELAENVITDTECNATTNKEVKRKVLKKTVNEDVSVFKKLIRLCGIMSAYIKRMRTVNIQMLRGQRAIKQQMMKRLMKMLRRLEDKKNEFQVAVYEASCKLPGTEALDAVFKKFMKLFTTDVDMTATQEQCTQFLEKNIEEIGRFADEELKRRKENVKGNRKKDGSEPSFKLISDTEETNDGENIINLGDNDQREGIVDRSPHAAKATLKSDTPLKSRQKMLKKAFETIDMTKSIITRYLKDVKHPKVEAMKKVLMRHMEVYTGGSHMLGCGFVLKEEHLATQVANMRMKYVVAIMATGNNIYKDRVMNEAMEYDAKLRGTKRFDEITKNLEEHKKRLKEAEENEQEMAK